MIDVLQKLLAFAVTLGVLITFHELGHYFVARLAGVKVLRFSLGFGPRLRDRHAWTQAAVQEQAARSALFQPAVALIRHQRPRRQHRDRVVRLGLEGASPPRRRPSRWVRNSRPPQGCGESRRGTRIRFRYPGRPPTTSKRSTGRLDERRLR